MIVHFVAHNEVFQLEDLTDEPNTKKMFTLVHGNKATENDDDDDQLSLNHSLFISGKHMFKYASDRETVNVTDDNASRH